MKRLITITGLVGIVLSACSPSAQAVQTAIAQTQAPHPATTQMPTPAASTTPRPSPTARVSPTPDECSPQSALDWLNRADPIFAEFLDDGSKAVEMLGDLDTPIDVAEMKGIYQRNVAREAEFASITPPPCLEDAHDKIRMAFSDYSAMFKAMSEDNLDEALSAFYRAKEEWEEAFALLEDVSKDLNIPLQ